jgi:predicted hotdog family 3-hydroxylacyl-ACP dehydratase
MLDIEKMAQEVGAVGAVGNVMAMGRSDGMLFSTSELEAYTRLVVDTCATTAWSHTMDTCKSKEINPANAYWFDFCSASAIRGLMEKA